MPRRRRRLPQPNHHPAVLPRPQQDQVVRTTQPQQHHHIHRRVETRATQNPSTRRTPLPDPHTRHLHPPRDHRRPRRRDLSRRSAIRTVQPAKRVCALQQAQGDGRTSRRSSQPRTTTTTVEAQRRTTPRVTPMTVTRGGLGPPPATRHPRLTGSADQGPGMHER
jgi:hypothetical protein